MKFIWLLVFAAFAAGFILGRPWSMALGGLVLTSFTLALAANFRGLADTFPTRTGFGPVWQERSPAMIRATFGFFAVGGAAVCITGVVRLIA
jgi:hypothetical protein